jgi:CheY-like chemotaxis protein
MPKRNILLVDADARSLRVLEVTLRQAGYMVTVSRDGEDAVAKLLECAPDLLITETRLPKRDGYSLIRWMKARAETAGVPALMLTQQGSVEDKIRGLELGVEDYVTKPVFVRELLARVQMVFARKTQAALAQARSSPAERACFKGSIEDMGLVDLLQVFESGRKTGVLQLHQGAMHARVFFRAGKVVDAELGRLKGEEAIYRALVWRDADFEVEFGEVLVDDLIGTTTQAILMEGLRRADEWGRLAEQLPPLDAVFTLERAELDSRLSRIPEALDGVLRLIDGTRTLMDIVNESPFDDLSTLSTVSKLFFEGFLVPKPLRRSSLPPAEGSRQAPSASDAPEQQQPALAVSQPPAVAREHDAARSSEASFVASESGESLSGGASQGSLVDEPQEPPDLARNARTVPPANPRERASGSVAASAPPETPSLDLGGTSEPDAVASPVPAYNDASDEDLPLGVPLRRTVRGSRLAGAFVFAILSVTLLALGARRYVRGEHDNGEELRIVPLPLPSVMAQAPTAMPSEPVAPLFSGAEMRGVPGPSAEPQAASAKLSTAAPVSASAAPSAPASPQIRGPEPASVASTEPPRGEPRAAAVASSVSSAIPGTASEIGRETAQAQKALEQQKPARAAELARRAVGHNPKDAEGWLTLGAAYDAAGQKERARGAYRNCIAHGEGPRVTECRALLGE